MQYLVDEDTFCPTTSVPIAIVKRVVVLDDSLVLLGDPPGGSSDNVVVVLPFDTR